MTGKGLKSNKQALDKVSETTALKKTAVFFWKGFENLKRKLKEIRDDNEEDVRVGTSGTWKNDENIEAASLDFH